MNLQRLVYIAQLISFLSFYKVVKVWLNQRICYFQDAIGLWKIMASEWKTASLFCVDDIDEVDETEVTMKKRYYQQ